MSFIYGYRLNRGLPARLFYLIVGIFLTSCATFDGLFEGDTSSSTESQSLDKTSGQTKISDANEMDKNPHENKEPSVFTLDGIVSAVNFDDDELELENQKLAKRNAQLKSKIDEIHNTLLKHKEKIRILEKGLLLGVIPSELKDTMKRDQDLKLGLDMALENIPKNPLQNQKSVKSNHLKSRNEKSFLTHLDQGMNLYKNSRYAEGIVRMNQIKDTFNSKTTGGVEYYWVGYGWFKLKEYQKAIDEWNMFLTNFSNHSYLPRAKFYLAKAELSKGFRKRAVTRLKGILKDHPYDGSAAASRELLANMQRNF